MCLTKDRTKQAILHPEQHVRNAAVYYFSRSFCRDKDILPLVIQAIEKYGNDEAFQAYSFLKNLGHTDESVRWVVGRLKKTKRPKLDDDFFSSLPTGLISSFTHADATLLQPHQDIIPELDCLDEDARLMVSERIRMASTDAVTLWNDLWKFCEQHKGDRDLSNRNLNHAHRLIEALGRHPTIFGERLLELLAIQIEEFENNPMMWMELFAVRIAGEMRLEPAVPSIVSKLHEDADWLNEECLWALTKIGTDSVIEALADDFPNAAWSFRLSSAAIFEDIHLDLVVEKCFALLEVEKDEKLRTDLYKALLINGATAALEPVHRLLLATEHDPEWLELRSDLVTAATIMDITFPELAEWREDMQYDVELRKQWYSNSVPRLEDEDLDEEYFDQDEEEWLPPPTTVVTGKKVRRNDPCPCGSGKKYKKCCMKRENGSILN